MRILASCALINNFLIINSDPLKHNAVGRPEAEREKWKTETRWRSRSASDLLLRGDVQVLQLGIEQQVLVDLVARDVALSSPVHLRVGRQVHLQHLHKKHSTLSFCIFKNAIWHF